MKLSLSDRAWFDKVLCAITSVETGPSATDLAWAPLLSHWKPAISSLGHVMLWGEVTDHPTLGHASITTSHLIAINSEAGWARTASRWYQLGRGGYAVETEPTQSVQGKGNLAGSFKSTPPGFTNIDDPELLARLLAEFIERVHEVDKADRAASAARA